MQFTHAGNEGLINIFIGTDLEGGIFFRQTLQRKTHFFLISFGFGFNGNGDNRFGESNLLQHDRFIDIAESVAGKSLLQANGSGNIAGTNLINLLTAIGVHAN